MEAPNYFRTAFEFFKRTRRVGEDKATEAALLTALKAPKFALPKNGRILDNGLKGLPEAIRLPFPTVVLEYATDEDPLKEVARLIKDQGGEMDRLLKQMEAGKFKRDKIIIVAEEQLGENKIAINIIAHDPFRRDWTSPAFQVDLTPDRESALKMIQTGELPVTLYDEELGLSEKWLQVVVQALMMGPTIALFEFCEAMSISNISAIDLPTTKMTFTEKRKKATPYDTYKVLVVDRTHAIIGAGVTEDRDKPDLLPGERRQSREHLRRGHMRHYKKNDLKVWINPMIINAGVGGRIIKDYQLKGTKK